MSSIPTILNIQRCCSVAVHAHIMWNPKVNINVEWEFFVDIKYESTFLLQFVSTLGLCFNVLVDNYVIFHEL